MTAWRDKGNSYCRYKYFICKLRSLSTLLYTRHFQMVTSVHITGDMFVKVQPLEWTCTSLTDTLCMFWLLDVGSLRISSTAAVCLLVFFLLRVNSVYKQRERAGIGLCFEPGFHLTL